MQLSVRRATMEPWLSIGDSSALTHHGILPGGDGALHVEVPANASRLRLPDREVVLHWSGVAAEGTRLSVGVAAALAQSARCRRR